MKKPKDLIIRKFRLIDEFEKGEKGKDPTISYGLMDANDRNLQNWNAMIMGP